jgi:hypothetical protein
MSSLMQLTSDVRCEDNAAIRPDIPPEAAQYTSIDPSSDTVIARALAPDS